MRCGLADELPWPDGSPPHLPFSCPSCRWRARGANPSHRTNALHYSLSPITPVPATPGSIPAYWIWAYYISPFAWALRCIVINEFASPAWSHPAGGRGRGGRGPWWCGMG